MRIQTRPPPVGMRVAQAARAAPRDGTPAPDEAGLACIPVRRRIPYFPPAATWMTAPAHVAETAPQAPLAAPIATLPPEP